MSVVVTYKSFMGFKSPSFVKLQLGYKGQWETEMRNFPKNLDPHFFYFNIKEKIKKTLGEISPISLA